MINATLRKFGHPENVIHDYQDWCVLLRPAQVTLGSLILGAKHEVIAFSALPARAFSELKGIVNDIEASLKTFRSWDKINYLMLMMVDPHVHFHVIPRYRESQEFAATRFPDKGWPAAPDLASPVVPDDRVRGALIDALKASWKAD